MSKINFDDYFAQSNENKIKPLDSPEDLAEAARVNREMRIVSRQVRSMFARSRESAKKIIYIRD